MNFSEDFLHYVWQFKQFDFKDLCTNDAVPIQISHPGHLNKNSGPDFSNAKIKIGDTFWAGNVEIHIKSSDWLRHNHQTDRNFENVILHVVYEHDVDIQRADGSVIPVLQLKERISERLVNSYENLFLNLNAFPCEAQIGNVDPLIVKTFLNRIVIERFEQKTKNVFETLAELNGNWDETFYRFLAKNFGFKVNALPFELLAKTIPQRILAKHKDQKLSIEALIFGSSGFLSDELLGAYPQKLIKEFKFLQKKYNIKPIDVSLWKFLRMRPQNFPTIRLAQFAGLIVNSQHLFSNIIQITEINRLRMLFENLPIDAYWKTHYHFRKEGEDVSIQIGKSSIDNILLNTVATFLFAYGKHTANQDHINRSILLLEGLPPEKNSITDKFNDVGLKLEHAFASQGILQLKNQYCNHKKCLSCGIGIKILKQI